MTKFEWEDLLTEKEQRLVANMDDAFKKTVQKEDQKAAKKGRSMANRKRIIIFDIWMYKLALWVFRPVGGAVIGVSVAGMVKAVDFPGIQRFALAVLLAGTVVMVIRLMEEANAEETQ